MLRFTSSEPARRSAARALQVGGASVHAKATVASANVLDDQRPAPAESLRSLLRLAAVLPLVVGAIACGQGPSHPSAAADGVTDASDGSELQPTSDETDACVGVEATADALPVDLFAVVDRSGSMADVTHSGISKWSATKAVFRDFLGSAPKGMRFGLSLFPMPGRAASSCASDLYRERALPIGDVTEMASAALASFDAQPPQGQTPTAPALAAALDLASDYAKNHVDRSVVVVLATDGLPTECAPRDAAALARLARVALESEAHVRTLVVVSLSEGTPDTSGFEAVALAGGTGRVLYIDPHADFARQLTTALDTAAHRKVACDLALPAAPPGEYLDYGSVNVVLDGPNGRAVVPRVASASDCKSTGGWYYDIDPETAAPSRLNMCKSVCERTSGATALRVELGCRSLVR